MKDFDRLRIRFMQFGGWRLIVQYARMGVLWIGVKEIIRCAIKGKSMKTVYPKITQRVDEILWEKYGPSKSPLKGDYPRAQQVITDTESLPSSEVGGSKSPFKGDLEGRIWFCWLQGLDHAPELVHACLKSLRSLPDTRVIVVDIDNYRDYIEFPDYILEKYHKGYIPHANMSDMLRLALLSKYGGVWIDATVLCTYSDVHREFWRSILDSDFYIYRYIKNGRVNGISNWFIAAKQGNVIVDEVLQLLYAYWKDYNCVVDYYMMHLFIGWSAKRHPEYFRMMPKGNSYHAIMLGGALGKVYNEKAWNNLTDHVLFHKMTYRHTERAKSLEGSYYNHIIKEFAE
ncbi:MAG: hypothetical protein KBT34_04255 [Prevotella sp.]|nr:hypothetical protein [Candidatus Prevotella equi]